MTCCNVTKPLVPFCCSDIQALVESQLYLTIRTYASSIQLTHAVDFIQELCVLERQARSLSHIALVQGILGFHGIEPVRAGAVFAGVVHHAGRIVLETERSAIGDGVELTAVRADVVIQNVDGVVTVPALHLVPHAQCVHELVHRDAELQAQKVMTKL